MASSIDPASVRGMAQKFISSGVRLGLSGASILTQLDAAGLGYPRSTFYTDYARISASPPARQVPFGSLTGLTSFSEFPPTLLSSGPLRYQYIFTARTRNDLGQFNGGSVTWSFSTAQLLIPDIANGIGIALTPDLSTETYSSSVPSDSVPIYTSDIETYDQPTQLGS